MALGYFSLVALGYFEGGNLWAGEATGLKFGFFVDERADERQREAMLTIFGGQAGGTPAQLGAIWGQPELLGVEPARITFEVAEDLSRWRADIPGKVAASAEALGGPTTPQGQRAQTLNPLGLRSAPAELRRGAEPRRTALRPSASTSTGPAGRASTSRSRGADRG